MENVNSQMRLALYQINSSCKLFENLEKVKNFLQRLQTPDIDIIVLPENVLCRGNHEDILSCSNAEEYFVNLLGPLSREHSCTIVWGGIPVREDEKLYNVAMVFDHRGQLISRYRKIHLFQYHKKELTIDESSIYTSGCQPVTFQFKDWSIGLSICFDLRFPELYRAYAGTDVILCPSDFTYNTGKFHWEVLLRARAIENQCFIVGVNQYGKNVKNQVESYGHSMVIDPWGRVLDSSSPEESVIYSTLNKGELQEVQDKIPALHSIQHRIQW